MFKLIPVYHYESTNQNYGADAVSAPVPGLMALKRNLLDLNLVFAFSKKFTGYGRMTFLNSQYQTTAPQQESTGTARGAYEWGIGGTYRIWQKTGSNTSFPRAFDAVVELNLPMYDNTKLRSDQGISDSLPGDGTVDGTMMGFYTVPLTKLPGNSWLLRGGLGVMLRSRGYSPATLWQGSLVREPIEGGVYALLGFHAQVSVRPDTKGEVTLEPNYSSRDAGNSLILGARNSSAVIGRGLLGYQTKGGYRFFTGLSQTLLGRSTANVSAFTLGVQIPLGGHKKSKTNEAQNEETNTVTVDEAGADSTGVQVPSNISVYDLEGTVIQSNEALKLIKIDKGAADGITRDQLFDVFRPDELSGESSLVARGKISQLGSTEAILTVFKFQTQSWIRPGFIIKRVVQ